MEALGEGVMNALACEAVVSRVWYALPSCDPLHAREAALGDEGQHTLLSLQHTPSALLLSRNNHQSTRTWRSHTQVRPSIACGGDMYGLVKNLYTYLVAFTVGAANRVVRNAGSDQGFEARNKRVQHA